MNKLKTIASAMVITMGFFSPVSAKVNQGSTIDTSAVSEIACQHMQNLADLGLVKLPVGCRDIISGHFTRDEMTILTLQAMSHLNMDVHGNIAGVRDTRIPGVKDVLYLRKLFYKDLQNKGMIEDSSLFTDLSPSSEATDEKKDEERKYKISGEVRYNYVKHGGNKRWDWSDRRLRGRLFLEGRINDNWHVFGMIEGNKHFLDGNRGNDDDWLDDKRLYVRGMLGDTAITAGQYSYELADGNIFDSSIKGVTANWGDHPSYEATAGRTKSDGDMAALNVKTEKGRNEYGGGVQHFGDDDWGTKNETIWDAWYAHHFTDHLVLGGMYLGASRGDTDGRHNGFVAKASWGNIQSWEPGSNEFDVRYYYQPKGTYVIHTMTGLADYMDGFRGLGLTYHHTVAQNLVLTLEYYFLRELTTGDKGKTAWGDLTYYF